MKKEACRVVFSLLVLAATVLTGRAQLIWTVGMDDNGWPMGDGGGANASFVQETGSINDLPGDPLSPEVNQQADNDYYFAGQYDTAIQSIIDSYGDYTPVGAVDADEEAAERAFAGADNDLRYHFNLPATLKPTDLLTVTFDAVNLDAPSAANSDLRYGVEIYFNGVLVQPEILIRPAQLDKDYTTPTFTLASVNAQVGPGFDNIVSLKGINYNNDGGGNWMGIDYVQLDQAAAPVPPATFPWAVGKDDNGWPTGDGGGPNTSFVQENGTINDLPGSPTSPEVDKQADNDYYFAGSYTKVIDANGTYTPVGLVPVNEEAAERAFAGADNDLRYHFNLPNTLAPTDQLSVSFDALNLDDPSTVNTDPRYGIEVYFNEVRVQPEIVIRAAQLGKTYTTPGFTLASVGAEVGPGYDNIVSLKGINHSAEGGGNWMGIDYVQLNAVAKPIPLPVLPWSVGMNDNGWPVGNGGGPSTTFVQENGVINPLPGSPTSPEVDKQADNDYYFAGIYTSVIPGNGTYEPVGEVPVNEEAAERAFAGADNDLRYHFNLPSNLQPTDQLSVAFDALNLDESTTNPDPRYGIEIYFNGVKVQDQILIRHDQLNITYSTPPFTLAKVNAGVGPGFDNIVSLRGVSYSADGGGSWMGIDYVQLNPVLPPPFPWSVGKDDNGWPVGNGGGPNTTFVQEAGSNDLPGNPNSPEADQQADDDYYFAGEYTQKIQSVVDFYADYDPVGTVLVNEEAAERAFAGTDNEKRYHFNLPSTLKPTDQLIVTFDALNLDERPDVATDPRYGVEIYFNGVLVQPEIDIRHDQLDVDYSTPPFTLASVNAQVGSGYDNIVTLRGISFSDDGGGSWMGIDYVQLDPLPTPTFPWAVGKDDNDWPKGDGGGPNATFVQENGTINDLPGNPKSPEVDQQADNDYYFAGQYTKTIKSVTDLYGDYTPAGMVPRNEEAAERAFAGDDNDLRYHFNLPDSLKSTDVLSVTFDALNLDESTTNPDPRYGIEVYFNGVKVQDQILIRHADLDKDFTTPEFTLASVNAQVGLGYDNIVSLKGISYSADGGGSWMGIDYVQLNPKATTAPQLAKPVVSNGKITLTWTGTGTLQSAPTILGPWTPVTPTPASGYSEDIVLAQNRFYRLAP
jgi:hypothetical protein